MSSKPIPTGPIERPLPLIGELASKAHAGLKTQSRRPISALNSLVDGVPDRALFARLWLAGAWVDPGPSPTGNRVVADGQRTI